MAKLKPVFMLATAPVVMALFVVACIIKGIYVGIRTGMLNYMRFVLSEIEKYIV